MDISLLSQQMNLILSVAGAEYTRSLRDNDLRGSQLPYLLAVCRLPGATQDTIAGDLGVDKSNIARQMSELESLGYVTRRHDENDRRRIFVEPTDRAYDSLPTLVEAVSDCQRELMRGMSSEEQELLGELMTRVAKNAARLTAQRRAHDELD
jgi:DNA-binding MarR family transcriptional regulator